MATLISVYSSNGLVGRCDAKCYNAKHEKCVCICGGRNHGKGQDRAIENTREMANQIIEETALVKGEVMAKLGLDVSQLRLF